MSSKSSSTMPFPKLIDEVQDGELRSALQEHLAQTRTHVKNVEKAFESLGEQPEAEKCLAFEGLTKEHAEMVEETSDDLIDLVDLGAAARTENYEIAAYETLRRMAKALGEEEAVALLDENLKQEKERAPGRRADRDAGQQGDGSVPSPSCGRRRQA